MEPQMPQSNNSLCLCLSLVTSLL